VAIRRSAPDERGEVGGADLTRRQHAVEAALLHRRIERLGRLHVVDRVGENAENPGASGDLVHRAHAWV
jgi:hypothetical protein